VSLGGGLDVERRKKKNLRNWKERPELGGRKDPDYFNVVSNSQKKKHLLKKHVFGGGGLVRTAERGRKEEGELERGGDFLGKDVLGSKPQKGSEFGDLKEPIRQGGKLKRGIVLRQ